jgi:hypothetical protein
MKIAFDLDNTLIKNKFIFPVEKPQKVFLATLIHHEYLRAGTQEIFNFCKQQKWETWIYTTSFRSSTLIKRNFWLYNIAIDGVINQQIHKEKVTINCSKHPPTFGIDVIVDDSDGVKMEGEKYNFNTVIIQPENENWVEVLKKSFMEIYYNAKSNDKIENAFF